MGRDRAGPGLDLLADIGGTNARFALARGGRFEREAQVAVAAAADPVSAIEDFLAQAAPAQRPRRAAFAIAGPVEDGRARLTNAAWRFVAAELEDALGLERAILVNDFAALAWALPGLGAADRAAVGGGAPAADAPSAVLGPGTGLGVAAVVPGPGGPRVLATEGGHATMAAADAREAAILERLRARFGHVSAERLLSGPGLVNLYGALAALDGLPAPERDAEAITEAALAGGDALCRAALEAFCAMLGTAAGNLALTLGARGGVYIGGGIVPRFVEFLAASEFRARFEAKGRFRDYLEAVPTWVVTHPRPAFLGLLALLAREDRGAG